MWCRLLVKLRARVLVWLMGTHAYRFTLRYLLPDIKLIHAPGPGYDFKEKLRRQMRPGYFLVSKTKWALTNLIIGGNFSHAAVVLGANKIAEMTARDFDVVDVNEFCLGTTHLALLRFKNFEKNYGGKVATRAYLLSSARYDTSFSLGVKALYCSELCYQSDFECRMEADLSDLVGLNRPYLSPDGVYTAPGLEVVLEWIDTGW